MRRWRYLSQPVTQFDSSTMDTNTSTLYYTIDTHTISFDKNGRYSFGLITKREGRFTPRQDEEVYRSNRIAQIFQKENWKETFVSQLSHLQKKFVRNGIKANEMEFDMIEDFKGAGEMAYQQFLYSSFSMLFASAAFSLVGNPYLSLQYHADENVLSSIPCMWRENEETEYQKGHIIIQPDSAAVLKGCTDVFGMMEMKSSANNSRLNLRDFDKCVLATASTALALLPELNKKVINSIAIPFIVAGGQWLSLYVTRVTDSGVPFVSTVDLCSETYKSGSVNCKGSPSEARWRCFVALAVLLDDFLASIKDCNLKMYEQMKANYDGDNIFSTTRSSKRSAKRNRESLETDASNTKQETSDAKQETSSNKQGTNRAMEREAGKAASCCGRFKNVVYPFTRFLSFGDDDTVVEYQSKSPFYFKGEYDHEQIIDGTSQGVFLKVWRVDDLSCPDSVEKEWMLQWRAHSYNVPVASPLSKELIKSKPHQAGHEYLVAAMEFVDFGEIHTIDDVISFSVALLSTVEKLHSKATVLHCDLKPNNVRWSKGVVKLIDFGRAQLLAEAKNVPGTRGYEAPEVERGEVPSIASDAFSAGKTIAFFFEQVLNRGYTLDSTSLAIKTTVDALTRANSIDRMSVSDAHQILLNLVDADTDSMTTSIETKNEMICEDKAVSRISSEASAPQSSCSQGLSVAPTKRRLAEIS